MCHHAQLQPDFRNMQLSDLETVSPGGSCVACWRVLTYTLRLLGMKGYILLPLQNSTLQTLCELSIWVELKKQEHQKQNEKHMTKPAKMCDICVKEWYPEHRKTMNIATEMERNREFTKVIYLKVL